MNREICKNYDPINVLKCDLLRHKQFVLKYMFTCPIKCSHAFFFLPGKYIMIANYCIHKIYLQLPDISKAMGRFLGTANARSSSDILL